MRKKKNVTLLMKAISNSTNIVAKDLGVSNDPQKNDKFFSSDRNFCTRENTFD